MISRSVGGAGCQRLSGREVKQKQKTGARRGGRGPKGPLIRPSAKVGWESGGPMGRWAGRVPTGGRQAGSVGLVDGVMGWLYCCLDGQECMESACFEASWPRNRACGALFLFSKQGARALRGRQSAPTDREIKSTRPGATHEHPGLSRSRSRSVAVCRGAAGRVAAVAHCRGPATCNNTPGVA